MPKFGGELRLGTADNASGFVSAGLVKVARRLYCCQHRHDATILYSCEIDEIQSRAQRAAVNRAGPLAFWPASAYFCPSKPPRTRYAVPPIARITRSSRHRK